VDAEGAASEDGTASNRSRIPAISAAAAIGRNDDKASGKT
jgi:hypothetical protein